ncbi:hypothetical protein CONLIGDRAFT_649766 [Coniochaeta ligniaria NRRL 30616]|uniref:HNH nuclease domain-containing protein n=1 Tax=Coniochaeta ligniaria NRRL 30616 TaxID=1408157 RepID=A0A1J7J041_9PEZI|nr:hypothetical protein CONLIGDRAFT_649766 [Coniochaeta ligniaria NRRL 30616]
MPGSPPESPLSPPPSDMNLDSQSTSSPPADSQPSAGSDSQVIEVPKTQAELWAAVRKRAIQMFKGEKEDPEYKESSSKKMGPLMHPKISWRTAQLLALIALCEDNSIKGYKGLTVNPRLWEIRSLFDVELDEQIERMLQDMERIAEIWMQAKPKQESAPTTTASGAKPVIAGSSGSHDGDGASSKGKGKTASASSKAKGKTASASSKAKGKAKATDPIIPAKRGSMDDGASSSTITKKTRQDHQGKDEDGQKEQQDRDQEDRAAQEKVRQYYNQISIPTGHGLSEGAHGWSVGARARSDKLFPLLSKFWPEEEVRRWYDAVTSEKGRSKNILPMEPTAHALFDRFAFALRPVRCPEQPNKRIYLQFDMNLEVNEDGFERRQPKNLLPLTNYRAPVGGQGEGNQAYEVIRHGQILEIENMDGDEDKLPSFDILNVTYSLTRIIGALKGAGLHALMFQGQPPEVDPSVFGNVATGETYQLPPFQEAMLQAALESGVITEETMPGWRQVAVAQEVAKQAREDQKAQEFVDAIDRLKGTGLAPRDQGMGEEENYPQGGSEDEPGAKKPNLF